jgi:hypothetical protein
MGQHPQTPRHELEEAAEGTEFFRTPGGDLQIEDARDQAEAAGWLPPDVIYEWPSVDTHQKIINRRQDLYEAMRRLEQNSARASGLDDWVDGIRDALNNLESALQRHVSEIERPDGLFDEVVERAPHLEADVDRLRTEHRYLTTACRDAIALVDAPSVGASELRRKLLIILARLAIHRQHGSELLFDTYNVDLAAAD